MSYFSMFPNILYDAKGDGKSTIMKDIFRRIKIKSTERVVGFDYYDVQDGEAPEIIADKYYGDVGLHWTILIANNIGIEVEEKHLEVNFMKDCSEAFLTGTAVEITPINSVDDYEFNDRDVTKLLIKEFEDYVIKS